MARTSKKEEDVSFFEEICKNCVWFTTPQGEAQYTCPERTNVKENSKACSDFKCRPFNIKEVKNSDNFLIEIRKKLKNKKFLLDKSVKEELESYFIISSSVKEGGKELRQVPVCSYGPKEAAKLASLFEKTQALRDRTLYIKLGVLSIMTELKTIESVGNRYIYENYNKYLQSLKTVSMRDIATNILLDPLSDKIAEVSLILEIANLVYENLKDTYFTLKEVKDIACAFLMSTKMS